MAEFVTWQERRWEWHFGDPIGEHRAVRSEVGVWDLSELRKWNCHGSHVLEALDRIFTSEVRNLQAGQARYTAFCDDNGLLLGDAILLRPDADRVWVCTARDADGAHFRRILGAGPVAVEEFTGEVACLQLQGPRSAELLCALSGQSCPARLRYFQVGRVPVEVAGIRCIVARVGYSGELGYELFCAMSDRMRLRAELMAAGARPYGLAAVESLRIEAGLIMLGRDYFPAITNPYDVSLGRIIKLDKGPFCGREALAVAPRHRRIATVSWEGTHVPRTPSPVLAGGETVGMITSACWSPTLHRGLGLTVLETVVATPGVSLEIHDIDTVTAVRVVQTPAYDSLRHRVRAWPPNEFASGRQCPHRTEDD